MKQLTQNLKDGKMEFLETPTPNLGRKNILVKNYYSAISAGTEGRSVRDARMGYISKAKSRPNEVKQVINTARKMGVWETYNMVMNKLTSPSPLGYSCAGEVIKVGEDVQNYMVGDLIACGGQGAVHAEIVSVYENLCVKIPRDINMRDASFTTIGSIAIQGIRQAKLSLGEYCVVIGLGLLGQITIQLLKAAGIKTIGVDIDQSKVELAKNNGVDLALVRNTEGLEEEIINYCDGYGADAVIITAATTSNDPANLAGFLSRQKAKVVSVGRVSTDFNRDAYYAKELDFRMSCSYGPGRYDIEYEEKGHDYPIGYVRWSENRNMKSFVDLLSVGKVNLDKLITHEFNFLDAKKAYDIINDLSEPYLGMVLKYDNESIVPQEVVSFSFNDNSKLESLNIGFIGAGSFAQKFLLPNLKDFANLISVATSKGSNAVNVAEKYSFQNATCESDVIISDENINTVFVATRHNTHAEFVLKSIRANKNVFVEKPLCMTEVELEEISQEYKNNNVHLMVGFNRRFAPQIREIINTLGKDSKKTINYRINLGPIADDHWTQDKEIGGGRIIGEVCHFIDLAMFLSNSKPELLSAIIQEHPKNLDNTLSVIIKFQNGSIANINYYATGNASLNKEYLEVHSNGISCVLDDFNVLTIYGNKKRTIKNKMDKGHSAEVSSFIDALKNNKDTPISFEEIYWATKMTFDLIKSNKNKTTIIY